MKTLRKNLQGTTGGVGGERFILYEDFFSVRGEETHMSENNGRYSV